MDVSIISREVIKPSSLGAIHHLKPFKLSFIDQITPSTYMPVILFYPSLEEARHFRNAEISTQLKTSLSETLSLVYTLSGRVKDNLLIQDYEEGVPFVEARVKNASLFDFLNHQRPELGFLNQFLPTQPFSYQSNPEEASPLAVQLNIFDRGGIALGLCFSHKIIDMITFNAFLRSWAANCARWPGKNNIIKPDLAQAALSFPPLGSSSSQFYSSLMESTLFPEGKYNTKRFVFDAEATASLKTKAKSERLGNPTCIEALTSFIWKCSTAASRSIFPGSGSGSSKRPSLAIHAVNIRPRTDPRLSEYSTGNLWWWAVATTYGDDETQIDWFHDLAGSTRQAFEKINLDFTTRPEVDQPSHISENFVELMAVAHKNDPIILAFTSWRGIIDFSEMDFGWGKPIWVGLTGGVRPHYGNLVILNNSVRKNEIEAWLSLDENVMTKLEDDPEFLNYAIPNPPIM